MTFGRRLREWFGADDRAMQLAAWFAFLWVLVYFARTSMPDPPMAPDSWYYLDLSRSAFSRPGLTHTIRAYLSPEPYTAGFPFLYPMALAITNVITGGEYRSGLQVNLVFLVGAALLLDVAGHRLFGRRGIGPTAMLLLTSFLFFTQDALGGGSIAMAVLWFSAMVLLLARTGEPSWRRLLVIGLLGGAWTMTRFDGLVVVGFLGLALVAVRLWRFRQLPPYFAGVLLGISPWIIYSLVHFGSVFASDASPIGMTVQPTLSVNYYFPDGAQTLLSNPGGWWSRVRPNVGSYFTVAGGILQHVFAFRFLAGAGVVTAVYAVVHVARRGAGWGSGVTTVASTIVRHRGVRLFAATTVSALVGLAITNIPPGFLIERYYSIGALSVLLLLIAVMLAAPARPPLSSAVVAGTLLFSALLIPMMTIVGAEDGTPIFLRSIAPVSPAVAELASCLGPDDRVAVVLEDHAVNVLGARFGKTAVYEPMNFRALDVDDQANFLREYRITAIYMAPAMQPDQVTWALQPYANALGIPIQDFREECTPRLFRFDR